MNNLLKNKQNQYPSKAPQQLVLLGTTKELRKEPFGVAWVGFESQGSSDTPLDAPRTPPAPWRSLELPKTAQDAKMLIFR